MGISQVCDVLVWGKGMAIARKKATQTADPYGMTNKKATATARTNTGVLPLRQTQGQNDKLVFGLNQACFCFTLDEVIRGRLWFRRPCSRLRL